MAPSGVSFPYVRSKTTTNLLKERHMALIYTIKRRYADHVYDKRTYTCQNEYNATKNYEMYVKTTWTPEPGSRPYPDDPIKSQTSWGTNTARAVTRTSRAALTPLVQVEEGPDPVCPVLAPQGYKRYYRYCTMQYRDQSGSLALSWPDWALPLRLKIKDETINLGTALAEYRQSVRMFGSAARGIVNAVKTLRGLRRFKRRSLCSITNAHLIHDYGIAPLMSDVYDTMEALLLRLERPVYRRYHFRQFTDLKERIVNGSLGTYGGYRREARRWGTQDVTAYVELDLEKASLFTFGNPAELIWEVTPFSFVVDWMIPIGDYLISLDAMKAVKSVNGCYVRKEKQWQETFTHVTDYLGNKHQGDPGSVYTEDHWRTKFTTVPLPNLPKFNPRASISTLLNAISLLVSVRGCKGVMPRYSPRDFGL